MSQYLRRIINNCDLLEAANEFYVETSKARGSSSFIQHYVRFLANAERPNTCQLFSGHNGSGKSSELRQLHHILETSTPEYPCPRHLPIYIDAAEYLNRFDTAPNDVLLAIAGELGATLQDKYNIKLADNYLGRLILETRNNLLAQVGVEKVEIGQHLFFGDLKATLKMLPKDDTVRAAVQDALRPQSDRLSDVLNNAFEVALDRLNLLAAKNNEPRYEGIVIIVDSLDRIQNVKGCSTTEASWRELFLRNAALLLSLKAHVVYTVPLELVRSTSDNLRSAYGHPAFVLPMVTVEKRRLGGVYMPGWECLRNLLAKRVGELPLTGNEGAFTEESLEFLLRYCGGHPRILLSLVMEAALQTDTLPINIEAARKSVVPTVRQFSPQIPRAYYAKMVAVTQDPEQQIDNTDKEYRNMLEQNWVLEYINGGDSANPFETTAPWYAVHPIIRELPAFKAAMAATPSVSP